MKIPALARLLAFAVFLVAITVSASAQTASGQIRAVKIEGDVSKVLANGTKAALKDGDSLTESDAVLTGQNSSVVLVFSNGASVRVGAESRLAIDEFKMDPFADEVKVADLKAEPTKSKTTLNLAYGEMVGDVKKLNKSSTYSIKTPVGAAGIRGTVYRIVFRPSADGKAFFTVSTAEGKVVMEGVTNVEVPVDAGKEVVVEIDTNKPGEAKVVTQDLSPTTSAAFTQAAQDISDAASKNTTSGSSGSTDTPKTDTTEPTPTPTPTVPSAAPTPTPGQGL